MKSSQVAVLTAVGVLALVMLYAIGSIAFRWPWESLDVATADNDVTYAAPARVISVEPIALDCRARITAEVPVEGKREHRLFGQVYRTDTVGLVAIGDVDTCVDASQVRIVESADGRFEVQIPGTSIEFVRPRVDAEATQDSVTYDQGLVGKLTDAFPWVDDGEPLTPAAYTFAQTVIGGSECMRSAYEVTKAAMQQAYVEQLEAQGAGAGRVEVTIEGEPDFSQHELPENLDDFTFTVEEGEVVCELAGGAFDGSTPVEPIEPGQQ